MFFIAYIKACNNSQVQSVYFPKQSLSWMFDRVLNTPQRYKRYSMRYDKRFYD